MRIAIVVSGLLLLAACGRPETSLTFPVQRPVEITVVSGAMLDSEIAREVDKLRASLVREMPQSIADDSDGERRWIARARSALDAAAYPIRHAQLIVVVDRSPMMQQLRIILARPGVPWQTPGGS